MGVALSAARRRKERAYPELVGPHRRARFVVLAGEVGGRWSEETWSFISQLAKAKSRAEPFFFTQESGTSLAAQVGRNAVLCGSKGVCFITLGASHRDGFRWRNPFVPRSGRGFQALRVGGLEWMRGVQGSRVT